MDRSRRPAGSRCCGAPIRRFRGGSTGLRGGVWRGGNLVHASPLSIAPGQIPAGACRRGRRNVIEARRAPRVAAQQPCQSHPTPSPQPEARKCLVGILGASRDMPAMEPDQRRKSDPVKLHQGARRLARTAPKCLCYPSCAARHVLAGMHHNRERQQRAGPKVPATIPGFVRITHSNGRRALACCGIALVLTGPAE